MKNISYKKTLLTIILMVVLGTTLFTFNVYAADQENVFQKALRGLRLSANEGFGGGEDVNVLPPAGSGADPLLFGLITIINYALTFTAIVFFLVLIYGGYLWMMARGNEQEVEKGKKITRDAIIGILIIVLARVITEFILQNISTAIDQV